MANENFYRQTLPDLDLSIERATESTPDTSKYHVIRSGEVVSSYRFLREAKKTFRKIVEESGYSPPPVSPGKSHSEMMTERYMESKEIYWANSHKYRAGGGRGGRGGV
jgi:hypothetical protein